MARQLYTEAGDKKVDAKLMKRLTPAQRTAFEKEDKKHRKVKYQDQDTAIDKKIIKKIKAKPNGKKSNKKRS
jgi:hypothetical protein